MSDQFVENDLRDSVINELLKVPDNNVCFDCKSKNPKWCSSNIGIFLCYQCTSKHRHMGVAISFVRSLKMDRWKLKELKRMELGGNKNAKVYFEENGMMEDGRPNHEAAPHARYKMDLADRADQVIKLELQALGLSNAAKPTVQQQQPHQMLPLVTDSNLSNNVLSNNPFDLSENTIQINTNAQQKKTNQEQQQATLQTVGFVANQIDNDKLQVSSGGQVQKKTNSLQLQQASNNQNMMMGGGDLGGLNFALRPDDGKVKKIGAKKLDIDFGSDDFFNSFQPAAPVNNNVPSKTQLLEVAANDDLGGGSTSASSSNVGIKVNDPFEMASSVKQQDSSNNNYGPNDQNMYVSADQEREAREKLRSMGNRKTVSSADFQNNDQMDAEMAQKISDYKASGVTQISSDMIFGRASAPEKDNAASKQKGYMESIQDSMGRVSLGSMGSGGGYDEYKEAATRVAGRIQESTGKMGESAGILKAQAMDWFGQFSAQK